jgi:hypothetical protein
LKSGAKINHGGREDGTVFGMSVPIAWLIMLLLGGQDRRNAT